MEISEQTIEFIEDHNGYVEPKSFEFVHDLEGMPDGEIDNILDKIKKKSIKQGDLTEIEFYDAWIDQYKSIVMALIKERNHYKKRVDLYKEWIEEMPNFAK